MSTPTKMSQAEYNQYIIDGSTNGAAIDRAAIQQEFSRARRQAKAQRHNAFLTGVLLGAGLTIFWGVALVGLLMVLRVI